MIDTSLSPETAAIRDALIAVPIGETISYADLSAVIGRSVSGKGRAVLFSARRIAERDHGAAFEAIRKVGLRRVPAAEAPRFGAGGRAKIKRAARRAVRTMTRIIRGANDVPADVVRDVSRETAALNLIEHISEKRIDTMADDKGALPPAKAATAFLRHIGAE